MEEGGEPLPAGSLRRALEKPDFSQPGRRGHRVPLLRTGWAEASSSGAGTEGSGRDGAARGSLPPTWPLALKDRAQPGEPLWTGPVVTRPAGHRSPYCSQGARPSPDPLLSAAPGLCPGALTGPPPAPRKQLLWCVLGTAQPLQLVRTR